MRTSPHIQYTARRSPLPWVLRLGIPLVGLFALLTVSAVGFKTIQPELNWLDAFYTALLTIATVENSIDGGPLSQATEIWSMIVLIVGLLTMIVLGAQIAAFMVDLEIRNIFGRRQMQKRIKKLKGHMIICGLGRTGLDVAEQLADSGAELFIVDLAEERLAIAERNGWPFIQGNATDEDILASLKLDEAAAIFACLNSDAENLFICLSAKQENPQLQAISLASDEASVAKLKRAGADRVICPKQIGASQMADVILRPAMVDFIEIAHSGVDLEMDRLCLAADSDLIGQSLQDLALPLRFGVHVVAIRGAGGEIDYQPTALRKLHPGDELILVGKKDAVAELR